MIRKILVSSLLVASMVNATAVLADAYYPALKPAQRSYTTLSNVSSVSDTSITDLQAQIDDLDARLKATSSESTSLRQEIERQIAALKQNIEGLRAQGTNVQSDVNSLNTKVVGLIAENEKRADVELEEFIGPFFTAPVGLVLGAVRGTASKSVDHSKDLYDALGGGVWGTAIGAPVGFIGGAVSGLFTGGTKGLVDGVVIGVEEPFSLKSISSEGKYLDFDSYDIF
jgi:hypothetical protein